MQVERLEAEADRRGPVMSFTNSDLASPTSDSLFVFTDDTEKTEKDTASSEAVLRRAVPSQGSLLS